MFVATPIEQRFAAKVAVGDGCWEWLGARLSSGYGCIGLKGRNLKAHRVAYELFQGPIGDGLRVCHRCDNPGCVNPAHLFVGTNRDNMRDMVQKGRNPDVRGELHGGARLTEEDVADIRRRAAEGEQQKQLAAEYGVSRGHLCAIVSRKKWRHV